MSFLDNFKNKKIISVTHNDLDGIGSAILSYYYILPVAKEFLCVSSDKYDLCTEAHLDIYLNYYDIFLFTDFPVDRYLVEKIKNKNKQIIVCDHHQSGHTWLQNLLTDEEYFYDITRCGTKIFLDKIAESIRIKKVVYQFVERVSTYDLWQDRSSLWRESKGLHNLMWSKKTWDNSLPEINTHSNFINTILNKFKNDSTFHFTNYELKIMLDAEGKEREAIKASEKKLQIRIDTEGNKYGYTECTSKQSIVASHILATRDDIKYLAIRATFNDTKDTKTPKISLRTREDRGIDVSIIAEKYFCGGHRCAAGIEFKDYSFFEDFVQGKKHLI